MPRGDGTGPMGYGPYTGRGLGRCRPRAINYNRAPGYGRAFAYSPENRKAALQEQLLFLEEQMELIRQELEQLK